jgi:hypothetical protein
MAVIAPTIQNRGSAHSSPRELLLTMTPKRRSAYLVPYSGEFIRFFVFPDGVSVLPTLMAKTSIPWSKWLFKISAMAH